MPAHARVPRSPWHLLTLLTLVSCGQFRTQTDNAFGDQHFKTAIALIELHKVRFGEYPASLTDLQFTGQWDQLALTSVEYHRVDSGYSLDVIKGWVGKPSLNYPATFWHGLGLRRTNMNPSLGVSTSP